MILKRYQSQNLEIELFDHLRSSLVQTFPRNFEINRIEKPYNVNDHNYGGSEYKILIGLGNIIDFDHTCKIRDRIHYNFFVFTIEYLKRNSSFELNNETISRFEGKFNAFQLEEYARVHIDQGILDFTVNINQYFDLLKKLEREMTEEINKNEAGYFNNKTNKQNLKESKKFQSTSFLSHCCLKPILITLFAFIIIIVVSQSSSSSSSSYKDKTSSEEPHTEDVDVPDNEMEEEKIDHDPSSSSSSSNKPKTNKEADKPVKNDVVDIWWNNWNWIMMTNPLENLKTLVKKKLL